MYVLLERFEDAVVLFEELRRRGAAFAGAYYNLAICYDALGRMDEARQVLDTYLQQDPRSHHVWWALGYILVDAGRLEEARAAFDKADAIELDVFSLNGRAEIPLLEERWDEADAIAIQLRHSSLIFGRVLGAAVAATRAQFRGQAATAARILDDTGAREKAAGPEAIAPIYQMQADFDVQIGRPEAALAEADRILETAHRGHAELLGLFEKTRALVHLGRFDEADAVKATLAQRLTALPSDRLQWHLRIIEGETAMQKKDTAGAIQAYEKASALLPPRPNVASGMATHVITWYDLGSAYVAAHNDPKARDMFERLVNSGAIRLRGAAEYALSLYALGEIAERTGNRTTAAEYYSRFLKYWADGDASPDRVAAARAKLARM